MCEEFMDLMLTPDDRDIVEFAGSLGAFKLILMKRSFYLYPPSTREQAPTSSCIMIVVGRKGVRANHLAFCCALYLFVTSEGLPIPVPMSLSSFTLSSSASGSILATPTSSSLTPSQSAAIVSLEDGNYCNDIYERRQAKQ